MIRFLKELFSPSPPAISSFGRTDTGLVRDHNEDSFAILENDHLYLVADGMGGHNAGEVASKVAIESLVEFFSHETIRHMAGNPEEIQHQMINSLYQANEKVMAMAADNDAFSGMGCTLVACLVDGNTLHTCHVGDARCYQANREGLHQITTDHTALARFEKSTEGRTRGTKGPPRHILTRAIGFPFPEDPEYHANSLKPKDRILICSDGLWSMLPDDRLYELLLSVPSPEKCCDIFIREANEAGGKDNITALVLFC